jgi:hypothetical protein
VQVLTLKERLSHSQVSRSSRLTKQVQLNTCSYQEHPYFWSGTCWTTQSKRVLDIAQVQLVSVANPYSLDTWHSVGVQLRTLVT